MTIGSTVITKNGPMRVLATRRFTGSGFCGAILADSDGVEWLVRYRPGTTVNRTHKLVPN
jgi:hypothetical protein